MGRHSNSNLINPNTSSRTLNEGMNTMLDMLSSYSGIPVKQLQYLLSLSPAKMYQDSVYQNLVRQLNAEMLQDTLVSVRETYDKHLPTIKRQYNLRNTTMSGFTLANWIIGFLSYPDRLPDLLERHVNVPPSVIADVAPDLLAVLGEVPRGGAEWQRALTVFILPLLARN